MLPTPLATAHSAIEAAVLAGTGDGLRIVGFGEVTLAVAWPADEPVAVCKRLPPFAADDDLAEYTQLLHSYVETLVARGVHTVPTQVMGVREPRWGVVGYLVQPYVEPSQLLSMRLRHAEPAEVADLFERLVGHVVDVVDDRVGLDAQVSNWCVGPDGALTTLDVSTPFLRDAAGRDLLPTALFLRTYPMLLRPALGRFVVPDVVAAYHDVDEVLLDVAGNLLREGLDARLPAFLTACGKRTGRSFAEDTVRSRFTGNARTWGLLQRLRRADRWWQRTLRRRPYPQLLPPPYNSRAYSSAPAQAPWRIGADDY